MDYSASYDPYTANGAKYFGHADLDNALASGKSVAEIQSWANSNLDKMPGGNGTNSKVYKDLMAMSSGGGGGSPSSGGGQQMAGSQQFQNNLNEATQAYRPEEVDMNDFNYGNGGKYDNLGKDFNDQVQKEQLIKKTDPFGDSWNSTDFFGKHITMGRQAQEGRQDASGIANKYIFNASQTNPVDIQALDKQIRTNPLYSESKAELSKLKTFGDTYANSQQNPVNWVQPQPGAGYEPPDFNSMYKKTTEDIRNIDI